METEYQPNWVEYCKEQKRPLEFQKGDGYKFMACAQAC
jgi:hypothetical protein